MVSISLLINLTVNFPCVPASSAGYSVTSVPPSTNSVSVFSPTAKRIPNSAFGSSIARIETVPNVEIKLFAGVTGSIITDGTGPSTIVETPFIALNLTVIVLSSSPVKNMIRQLSFVIRH